MKANGGMRGMYSAFAKALGAMGPSAAVTKNIIDRAPGFQGIGPKIHPCRRGLLHNNKKPAHQGAQECQRRLIQMRNGILRYSNSGYLNPFEPYPIYRRKGPPCN